MVDDHTCSPIRRRLSLKCARTRELVPVCRLQLPAIANSSDCWLADFARAKCLMNAEVALVLEKKVEGLRENSMDPNMELPP